MPHRLDWTSRISIHPVLSFSALTPALTHTAAHFLGHLFLRLFQLFEEFASQIGRIPTAPSKAPHPAICLWSLNGVFCLYTGLLLLLFLHRQGSAAVQEHYSWEHSPLHFNLPNQWKPQHLYKYMCPFVYNSITIVSWILMVFPYFRSFKVETFSVIWEYTWLQWWNILIYHTQQSDDWDFSSSWCHIPHPQPSQWLFLFLWRILSVACLRMPVIKAFLYFWLLSSSLLCLLLSVNNASFLPQLHPLPQSNPTPLDPTCLSLPVLVLTDIH